MGRPKKNPASGGTYAPKKIQGLDNWEDIVAETDSLWSVLLKRLNKLSRIYGFQEAHYGNYK